MQIFENWGNNKINYYLRSKNTNPRTTNPAQATRHAVLLSFAVGALVTFVVALVDVTLLVELSLSDYSPLHWVIFLSANGSMVAIELWLLFHIGFHAVAQYIKTSHNESSDPLVQEALVRAVLELDEPESEHHCHSFLRKQKKHHWIMLLLYKLKVIMSDAVAKVIARKLLGRVGLRAYVPFISVLVVAFWDAWVQAAVLKEGRFRMSSRIFVIQEMARMKSLNYSNLYAEALLRLIVIRYSFLENQNNCLSFFIVEVERHYHMTIDTLEAPNNITRFEEIFTTLNNDERNRISEIGSALIVFPNKRLKKDEATLLKKLGVTEKEFKTLQREFDQLKYTVKL